MIYHNVGLTKAEIARLRRVVKNMLDSDDNEIKHMPANPDPAFVKRNKVLLGRRKYITKANLLRIFALRGLENMEQGGNEEETIDLMVRLGRAKGRPDGRK